MKRPLRNMVLLFTGDAGGRIIGFFVSIYLARVLEPSGFGMFTIGMAVLGYLLLVASPGIQVVEMRNVAALPDLDGERIGGVLTIRLVLATALWGVTALAAPLLVDDPALRTVIVLAAATLIPMAMTLDWYFLGKEEGAPVTRARLAGAAVTALATLAMVNSPADLPAAPLLFAGGACVSALILVLAFRRRHGWPELRWDPGMWRKILAANLPVGFATFLGQHVVNLPPIVLGLTLSAGEVGEFSAAMKIVVALLVLDRLIGTLFLPVIARTLTASPSGVTRLYSIVLKTVAVVALPLGVIGTVLAPPVTAFLYGHAYDASGGVLQILVWYAPLTLLNSVHVATLIGAHRERTYTFIMVIASTLLVALVVGLALIWGAAGAAAGVVGGELAAFLLLSREAGACAGARVAPILAGPAGAAALMAAGAVASSAWSPLASASVAAGVYLIAVPMLKAVARDEIQFLRERLV